MREDLDAWVMVTRPKAAAMLPYAIGEAEQGFTRYFAAEERSVHQLLDRSSLDHLC